MFGADDFDLIRTISFDGVNSGMDESTGHPVEPYLISVTVDVSDFNVINLDQVDPVACIQVLAETK